MVEHLVIVAILGIVLLLGYLLGSLERKADMKIFRDLLDDHKKKQKNEYESDADWWKRPKDTSEDD